MRSCDICGCNFPNSVSYFKSSSRQICRFCGYHTLTPEQKKWIDNKNIPSNVVFDAANLTRSQYQRLIEETNHLVISNTVKCAKRGHDIRTKSGKCAVCDNSSLRFTLRYYETADLYIAFSESTNLVKIGITSTGTSMRLSSLNEQEYGGINDWKMLYSFRIPRAGEVESSIHRTLSPQMADRTYRKNNEIVKCRELFECDPETAKVVVIESARILKCPIKKFVDLTKK